VYTVHSIHDIQVEIGPYTGIQVYTVHR